MTRLSEIDADRIDRAIPRQRNGLRNCPGIDGCRREGFLSLFRLDTHLRQTHSTNVEDFLLAFERRSPAPPRMPAAAPSQGREGRSHGARRAPKASEPPPEPPHDAEEPSQVVRPRAALEDLRFEASEDSLDLEPEDHDAEEDDQGMSEESEEPIRDADESAYDHAVRVALFRNRREADGIVAGRANWRVCDEPGCVSPGPLRGGAGLGGHRAKRHPRIAGRVGGLPEADDAREGSDDEKEETMPGGEPQVGVPNGRSATEEVGLDDETKRRIRALEREAATAISLPQMEVLEARMLPPFDRMLERYFEVLLEKAFAADEPDDALLDRIEALLLPTPAEIEVGEATDGR